MHCHPHAAAAWSARPDSLRSKSAPALGIAAQCTLWTRSVGGDDDTLLPRCVPGGKAQRRRHVGQSSLPCAMACPAQKRDESNMAASIELCQLPFAPADGERDIVFTQEFQPLSANEFPIRKQEYDRVCAQQCKIAPHQRDALCRARAAGAIPSEPHQRHPEPSCDDRQHENIDLPPARPPVGAIQSQPFGPHN